MPAIEIYDYVENATPDVAYVLSVNPQGVITFDANKPDVIHRGDDNDPASDTRLDFSGGKVRFKIGLNYKALDQDDIGSVMRHWCDSSYGNGRINSFPFAHPDGHQYVVCFESHYKQVWDGVNYSTMAILDVIGRVAE